MHGDRSMLYCTFVVFWPDKHTDICFSTQRRIIANKIFPFSLFEMHGGRSIVYSAFGLTSIMVYVFLSNAVSFFNFSYSICLDVDQWYILRLSSIGRTYIIVYEFLFNAVLWRIRKRRYFLFRFSKCMEVGQWYIKRVCRLLALQA